MKEKKIYANGVVVSVKHEYNRNIYDGSVKGECIKIDVEYVRVMEPGVDFVNLRQIL